MKTGGPALRLEPQTLKQILPRATLVCVVLAASGHVIAQQLSAFDGQAVLRDLAALSAVQVGIALMAVATAFVAVAGQERAVAAYLGLPMAGGRAAAASAAVSQTLGFGPVVGAIVRRRLRPDLTMGQSFAISAGITVGFFAGLGLLAAASLALLPGAPMRGVAMIATAAAVMLLVGTAVLPGPTVFGVRKPNVFIMMRFLGWLTMDLAALAVALWVVLPPDAAPAFAALLPVFLIALGMGVASGSPGGVGPFEATLLAYLPQVDAPGLVAGIITFRALAYAVPALCGAVWAVVGRGRPSTADPVTEVRSLRSEALFALPSAEAQLIRQGGLTLLSGPDSGSGKWLWLSGKLAHTRVVIGPVMGSRRPDAAAMQAVERLARSEARVLCLYKIDARLAVLARDRGHAVLPMAKEAVLNPMTFTTAGPDRARLRRKLSHARKAGVVVSAATTLSVPEMEAVVADWLCVHGRERGFSMGRWDRAYVAGQRVITARSAAGVLVAFITLHEGQDDWVLDLVRFRPGGPDGTTYAMVCCALDLARASGVQRLSLAAVPEAAFGLTGGVARIMQRATKRTIGLGQFKSAFAPRWEPRYVAAPSRMALMLGGLEIARAILRPGKIVAGRARLVVHTGGGGTLEESGATERAA